MFFENYPNKCLDEIAEFYDISTEELCSLTENSLVPFAKVVSAHGLKGDLKIKVLCSDVKINDIINVDSSVYFRGKEFFPSRLHGIIKDKAIILLSDKDGNIATINNHNAYGTLCLKRSSLEKVEFPYLLIGFKVFKDDFNSSNFFGLVVGVCNFGAGNMLEISINNMNRFIFAPFNHILAVDHSCFFVCVDSEIVNVQS